MARKPIDKISTKRTNSRFLILAVLVILVVAYIIVVIFILPMPNLTATINEIPAPPMVSFSWPSYGESAVGAVGLGVIGTNGEQKTHAIASIAKTVLALAVLKEKPLNVGEQGPNITITDKDVEYYKVALSQNGSVVPVAVGENLSEYQILQALLIPSGDNIADTLAVWAFGSIENYLNYANKMVADMELKQTHLADASGLSPESVSSAQDLVMLGVVIIQNPVLAEIVNQAQVELPVLGKANNYNTLLGQNNIIGIKTGNTDEAGGCLLFSAKKNIEGKDTIIVGAILGATNRYQVLIDTDAFLKNNTGNFKFANVVNTGQVVGSINTPWGKKIEVVAKDNLSILLTSNQKITISANTDTVTNPLGEGTQVGTISAEYGFTKISTPLVLKEKISTPPIWWKLIHP